MTKKSRDWYIVGPCADCAKALDDSCKTSNVEKCNDWQEWQKYLEEQEQYWNASNDADASLIAHVNRRR